VDEALITSVLLPLDYGFSIDGKFSSSPSPISRSAESRLGQDCHPLVTEFYVREHLYRMQVTGASSSRLHVHLTCTPHLCGRHRLPCTPRVLSTSMGRCAQRGRCPLTVDSPFELVLSR
jgi:hypothetical protein